MLREVLPASRAGPPTGLAALLLLPLLAGGRVLAAPSWLEREVTFRYTPPGQAASVAVAGTFNNWNPSVDPLEDEDRDGTWAALVRLEPGNYQYKFVVDGETWFEDPSSPKKAPDGFGGFNSVLWVDYDPRWSGPSRTGDGRIFRDVVHHDPDGMDQVLWATAENPALRFLSLRLAVKAGDVQATGVRIYRIGDRDYEGFRDFELDAYATTGPIEYRSGTFLFQDEPINDPMRTRWRGYRLWVDDGSDLLWVGRDTLATHQDRVTRVETLLRPQSPGANLPGSIDPSEATISDRIVVIPAWVQDAVFYQVFPERFRNGDPGNDPEGALAWGSAEPAADNFFGGDLQGLIDGLPYLDSLGVNVLYLTPIFASPSNHKYDTVNYKEIDPGFGSLELFKELVDRVHQRKMRIILDGVFNHVSDRHPYFQDAVEFGPESNFWSWFRIREHPVVTSPGPNYEAWSGLPHMPEWNTDNPEVRDYLFDVIRQWTLTGIDGWRLDVPAELPHAFWVQVRETIKAMNPLAYILGEIWGSGRPWLQGDQFDAVMNYRFRDACVGFFGDETLNAREFDDALGRARVDTPEPLDRLTYNLLGSHDTARILTACGGDEKRARLAVLFQMTCQGPPAVYYGDEVGLTGERDPGSRGTFPWRLADQKAPLREHYRYLIHMRREHPALRRGSYKTLVAEGGHYIFLRRSAEETIMVVINRTAEPASFKLKVPRDVVGVKARDAVDLLTGLRHAIRSGEVHVKDVPPMAGAVLQLR